MTIPGLSMVGAKVYYAHESTPNTKPSAFTQLTRIQSFGAISVTQNQVDATASDDESTKSIGGRMDNGGTVDCTFYLTPETKAEWQTLISGHYALTGGKMTWFQVVLPGISDEAFFAKLQPPKMLPSFEVSNGDDAVTLTVQLIINEYMGLDDVVLTAS